MVVKIICASLMFAVFIANVWYYIYLIVKWPSFLRNLKEKSEKSGAPPPSGDALIRPQLKMIGSGFAVMLVTIMLFALSGFRDPKELYLWVPFIVAFIVTFSFMIGLSIYEAILLKIYKISKFAPDETLLSVHYISTGHVGAAFFAGMFFGITCGLVAYTITIMVML